MENLGSPIPKKKRLAVDEDGGGTSSPSYPLPPTARSQPPSSHFGGDAVAAADMEPPHDGEEAPPPPRSRRERSSGLSEALAQSTADVLFHEQARESSGAQSQPQQERGEARRQDSNWSTMSVGAPTSGSSLPSDDGAEAAAAAAATSPASPKRPSPKKLKLDRAAAVAAASSDGMHRSASHLSLPLTSPLHTPREEEAVAAGGGNKTDDEDGATEDGAPSDDPMDAIRRLESAASSSLGGGRKRKHSVAEDILLGSRNSSSNSLPSVQKTAETKKAKAEEGTVEEKKDEEPGACFETYHRPASWSARRNLGGRGKATSTSTSAASYDTEAHPRWRTHQMAEDYISLASAVVLPPTHRGPFGYAPATGRYPLEQGTALGHLTSPLRRPTVIEKWNPFEIATFEAALALHGKHFHRVQKWVKTKTTKEIVEFYYVWKKTSHGRRWKSSYVEEMESDDESEAGEGKGESSPARGR